MSSRISSNPASPSTQMLVATLHRHSSLQLRSRYFRKWMVQMHRNKNSNGVHVNASVNSKLCGSRTGSSENSSSIGEETDSVPSIVPAVLKSSLNSNGSATTGESTSKKLSDRSTKEQLVRAIEAQQKVMEGKDRLINYLTSQRDIAVLGTNSDQDSVAHAADLQATCRMLQNQVKELEEANKKLAKGGAKPAPKQQTTATAPTKRGLTVVRTTSPTSPKVPNLPSTPLGDASGNISARSSPETGAAGDNGQNPKRRSTVGGTGDSNKRSGRQPGIPGTGTIIVSTPSSTGQAQPRLPQDAAGGQSVGIRVVEPPARSSPTASAKALGFTAMNANHHVSKMHRLTGGKHAAFGRSASSADAKRDNKNGATTTVFKGGGNQPRRAHNEVEKVKQLLQDVQDPRAPLNVGSKSNKGNVGFKGAATTGTPPDSTRVVPLPDLAGPPPSLLRKS